MSLVDLIIQKGLEVLGRYYGNYRGIVVDNTEDGQNRLSITIPSISRTPILAYPKGQDGSLDSGFKWFTPSIGQVVYIEFIQGDPNYPLWSYHGWGTNEVPDELKSNSVMGFKSKRGHLITLDEETGELNVVITDPTKDEEVTLSLTVDTELVTLQTKKDVLINSDGTITFNDGEEGLPLSSVLKTKLNNLEKDINSLKNAMKVAAPGVVALVPTFQPVVNWSVTTPIIETTEDEISNNKILQ